MGVVFYQISQLNLNGLPPSGLTGQKVRRTELTLHSLSCLPDREFQAGGALGSA